MQQEWHNFLAQQGAVWTNDRLVKFDSNASAEAQQHFVTPLVEHATIAIEGANTQQFLQGQLTCDTRLLTQNRHLLGAHCSAQGRMISSFHVLPVSANKVLLRLPQDNLETALGALRKYAGFSRVTAEPSTWVGLYIAVPDNSFIDLPEPGMTRSTADWVEARHYDGAVEIWGELQVMRAAWLKWLNVGCPSAPSVYTFRQIATGEAEVHQATQTMFIPQNFNYDLINGISFDKGCYTGQEVIARVHYRGQTKKRLHRAAVESAGAPLEIGAQITLNETVVGIVVGYAADDHRQEALICLHSETHKHNEVFTSNGSTVKFAWKSLPYAIPKE